MNAEERHLFSIDVAKMYYVDGKSQEYISDVTGMSRSNISRILQKCVEDGIVEIIVHDVISQAPHTAHKIQQAFHLKNVIIVPSGYNFDRTNRYIGERLSMFLMSVLRDEMVLGVARGRAFYYTAKNILNKQNIRVDVVQLQGAVSPIVTVDESSSLISLFASKLNGKGYVMNVPLMVKSKQTKEALMNSDILSTIIQKYQRLNAAIFLIERPRLHYNDHSRQEWLTRADILQLSDVDVVASVCGHYYNGQGVSCNVGINDRTLSINPELLRSIEYSIGVAVDRHSLAATLSILKSGLINVLVIDENLASEFDAYIEKQNAATQSSILE